jgi:hypothetical protein
MSRKRIQIALTDEKYRPLFEAVTYFVREHYDFDVTDDKNADFVFHSTSKYEVLSYPGVRIFATAEMVSPDFNITDYAIGFDRMTFGDRYLHLPLLRVVIPSYKCLVQPRPGPAETLSAKTGFCAYVMSNNTDSAPERVLIYDLLSKYRSVASGGAWRNNTGGRVSDKLAFQSAHKFVIAFENTSFPGYMTEKFSEAAASNAVPIYWGDPEIGRIFNPKAFINCHDFDSLEEVVEHVMRIDQDDDLYLKMLGEPWFRDGIQPPEFADESIAKFIRNIFDQAPEKAYRRSKGRWAIKYEKSLKRAFFHPFEQFLRNLKSRSSKR